MTRWVVVLAALGLFSHRAAADKVDAPGFFERLLQSIDRDLERAIAENRRKPPQPVAVTWKKHRLGTVDLGAPILDLTARDLDGDGKDELIAVTTTHVAVLRKSGHRKVTEVARVELPAAPAPIRTRAPVGTVEVATDGRILARASDQAEGVVVRFENGALSVERQLAGWPLCSDGTAELIAGHSEFSSDSVSWTGGNSNRSIDRDFLSAACSSSLVDPDGHPIDMFGFVDIDDKLVVRCHSDSGKCSAAETIYDDAGYAFELSDIDNDGRPEVIHTTDRPYAGLIDRVTISGPEGKLYSKKFGGGVVAVAAGDVDADGVREVIAVVRLAGATRVNLWTLN